MTLHNYCDLVSDKYIVCIGNSDFASRYTEAFVNFTVNFQVNDCRLIPIIIPTKQQLDYCNNLVTKAISLKQELIYNETNELLSSLKEIEVKLNDFINELYSI